MVCLQCPQGRAVSDCISSGRPREGPVTAQGSSGRCQEKGTGRPRKSVGRTQDGPGRAQEIPMAQGGHEAEGK